MAPRRIALFTRKVSQLVLLITCTVSMVGCGFSWMASRDTNPVIQDYTTPAVFSNRSVNIFATTASRRLAVYTQEKGTNNLVSCAEPSPDVGEAFAAAIATGLKASATVTPVAGGSGSGELAAEFGRAVATQIAPLLYRTQGLQLYRDAIYKLCIDRMNGWIESNDYKTEKNEKFEKAHELIKEELKIMDKVIGSIYENARAGNAQVNVGDIVKILEAQKK